MVVGGSAVNTANVRYTDGATPVEGSLTPSGVSAACEASWCTQRCLPFVHECGSARHQHALCIMLA